MKDHIADTVTLNDGVEMPWLGLGVWDAGRGAETRNAVRYALDAGYRHVDTAKIYGNEAEVGEAVTEGPVPREQVFVTTKLWNDDHGHRQAIEACERSLKDMGLDYLDLYLIHWPVSGKRLDSWRGLVKLREQGKCRSIGVSNFMIPHLEELLEQTDVVPAVNQVEFSPFVYERDLLEYCHQRGIRLEAYSPLTRGRRLDDETVGSIAAKYGKTPAQIMIRWALDHDVVVIPKSVHKERIEENGEVFDFRLSEQDLAALDGLNEDDRSLPPGWNPHEWA